LFSSFLSHQLPLLLLSHVVTFSQGKMPRVICLNCKKRMSPGKRRSFGLNEWLCLNCFTKERRKQGTENIKASSISTTSVEDIENSVISATIYNITKTSSNITDMTESTDNPNSNTRSARNIQNSNINNNTHNNNNIHKNNIQNDNTSSTTSKERRKQQQRQDQDQQQQQQVPELMTTTTTTIAIEQGLSSTSPLPQMSSTLSPSAMAHRCPYCHRIFNKKYNLIKHLENLSCPNSKVPSWN
jgi:hypothetical protein